MKQMIISDLEHNKRRLQYYLALRTKQEQARAAQPKSGRSAKQSGKETALDKWVEIYSERVKKLERQVQRLGLKTQLRGAADPASAKRA